jgi:hypothetical protein
VAETCSTRVKTNVLKVALKTVILRVKVFVHCRLGGMIVCKGMRRMWKEAVVAYCSLIFQCVCAEERVSQNSQTLSLMNSIVLSLRTRMAARVYSIFVLSCVGSGLATGSSHIQGFLPTLYEIHNFRINSELEETKGSTSSK